ncbi:MAG TPA: glycosyl hydrolase family 18 protein, partial [Clostridia bacterium]
EVNKYGINTEMVINMTDGDNSLTAFLSNQHSINSAVDSILKEAALYKGVNIDFEGLGLTDKGEKLDEVKDSFNNFIRLLYEKLKSKNLRLTLSLHAPNSSFKGYDYKELSKISDRIIVMAYDYGQKPEPDNLVIQAIEMAKAAVPKDKLFLGISAASENADSLKTKVGIAKRYNLEGVAIWRIGLLTNELWEALKSSAIPKGKF